MTFVQKYSNWSGDNPDLYVDYSKATRPLLVLLSSLWSRHISLCCSPFKTELTQCEEDSRVSSEAAHEAHIIIIILLRAFILAWPAGLFAVILDVQRILRCLVVFLKHTIGMCLLMYKYHSPKHYDLIWFQAVAGTSVCVLGEGIPGGTSVDQLQLSTDISEWMMKSSFSLSETSAGKRHVTHVYTHKPAPAVCWRQWKKAENIHIYVFVYTRMYEKNKKISKAKFKPLICIWKCWELTDEQWDALTIACDLNYRT